MKKLFALLFIGIFCISCSSDNDSDGGTVLSNTPLAKAEYDASNLGIYKGVFTGSSGVILVNVMNDGNINATMNLDGTVHTFTTTEAVTADGDINNLTFTSGAMSFDLSISQNGDSIQTSSLIFPGHPSATLYVVKEYSDALVTCYQGTFSGTSTGIFNFIVIDNSIAGLAYNPTDDDLSFIQGVITGTNVNGLIDETEGTFSGTVSGNSIGGNWTVTNPDPGSGTWTGQRTL